MERRRNDGETEMTEGVELLVLVVKLFQIGQQREELFQILKI